LRAFSGGLAGCVLRFVLRRYCVGAAFGAAFASVFGAECRAGCRLAFLRARRRALSADMLHARGGAVFHDSEFSADARY
jgi:hypothetical protein